MPQETSLVASQTNSGEARSHHRERFTWLATDGFADEIYGGEYAGDASYPPGWNETRQLLLVATNVVTIGNQQVNWMTVIGVAHTTIAFIGVVANFGTMVTIAKHGDEFSLAMRVLLTHQAFLDGLACVIAVVVSLEPKLFWKVNFVYIDYILCLFWHSEATYWSVTMVSIWNLVLIAVELYFAVLYPFKHQSVKRKHIVGVFCVMYFCFALYLLVSGFLRMKYVNGICMTMYQSAFLYYRAIINVFILYIIPMLCFIVLYSGVVRNLRSKKQAASRGQSDAASGIILRMAITVMSVFAVAIGYAQCYFALSFTGIIRVVVYSPEKNAAIVLNTCNFVANPFVYGLMLPAFRRSLKKTFGCACLWQKCSTKSSTTEQMTPQSRLDTEQNAAVSVNVITTF